ncbi:hypothetical protein GCM10010109_68580 [Actinoplanes campanulatus]|nr:hypothetical protein GCM10010109_68580 [Actinoplanes campanulatus]GID42363.1 hypothetical protein Aca09nite_88690 [Actinoplanes campanulatus]
MAPLPCPASHPRDEELCEREIAHEGDHWYTVWTDAVEHIDEVHISYIRVPDYPVFWKDTPNP